MGQKGDDGFKNMKNTFYRYLRVWRCLVVNSFRTQMSTSLGSLGYLIGKFLRFAFFLLYLLAIFDHLPSLKEYGMAEVVLFFMVFNLIDVGSQFLFRGIYGIKYLIEEGDFDKILTQPVHALFRISTMNVDLLDLLTLIPILAVTFWTTQQLPYDISQKDIAIFLLLLVNAMILTYAFHVLVASLSVRTQELESAIWVYRDVMTLGRFPVSIYSDLLRILFTTVFPIAVMVSFPSRALLGLLSWPFVLYAIAMTAIFHLFSQWIWRYTLREYTSISS